MRIEARSDSRRGRRRFPLQAFCVDRARPMINVHDKELRFGQCMIGVRKSDAMHHHTRATGDSIVRHKMCITITNVHRGNVAPIFLRRASFRSDKRHGRYHQDDERQNMSHSCKSEKTHTSRTLSWLKKRDCQQRSRIHFVTIIKPLRCWFFLTFQRWNIAPSDK